ncbi:hypothetical protein Back2_11320 [Nocardioides baekrokdamisoli]|uniref:Uncharacterized protein n=1 Tax=Nocardioides baekrokdamisoli TaxID=1804624 RepID=A0A3G9ILE3_9ACTN|nr:hypothetical protein [Nocardioides baekrokdamisoli]BBH16845.1 hypothetical protein Back2_11320 [Nocardioides baekrokdamisoli]
MTEDTPTPQTPPPAPTEAPPAPAATKTRIGDVIFGWKSAVVIFIGGLILGGLGGVGIGSVGHHHHHPRDDRMMHFRGGPGGPGGPGGYGYGGFQGGTYGSPGGQMIIPPGQPAPDTSKAPTPSASPKVSG